MVAYTKPQQWMKEESERLRGKRDQIKFIEAVFTMAASSITILSNLVMSNCTGITEAHKEVDFQIRKLQLCFKLTSFAEIDDFSKHRMLEIPANSCFVLSFPQDENAF